MFQTIIAASKEGPEVRMSVPEGKVVVVTPEEDKEVAELRRKVELIERAKKHSRTEDLLEDFSLIATQRLVYEMECAPKASERMKAATEVLHMAKGKPINKTITLTSNISEKEANECDQDIDKYMALLNMGSSDKVSQSKLIIKEDDVVDVEWTNKGN